MENNNDVLLKIAKIFNSNELEWGVGASKLMEKYGILISDDIDLFVARKHLDDAYYLLKEIGEEIEPAFNASYLSRASFCFIIDGVFVKIVSGLNIRHSTGIYKYSFSDSSIDKTFILEGEPINYMALEQWFVMYSMIPGRVEYAKMILKYFEKEKKVRKGYFEAALNEALPTSTRTILQNLMIKFN